MQGKFSTKTKAIVRKGREGNNRPPEWQEDYFKSMFDLRKKHCPDLRKAS